MWLPPATLTDDESVAEFDQWVTPTLGDLRDTDKFAQESSSLYEVIAGMSQVSTSSGLDAAAAVQTMIGSALASSTPSEAEARLSSIVSALYLVTAKSDNAVKCQYPIWYRTQHGEQYPVVRARRVDYTWPPTVLKSTDVVKTTVSLSNQDAQAANNLIGEYVGFLLSDEKDSQQLSALVRAFTSVERDVPGAGVHLLAPLVSFQVRGSVAASGGHDPEQIVRGFLTEWGLAPDLHFNRTDITAGALSAWLSERGDTVGHIPPTQVSSGDKTRAFDFVFPCMTTGVDRRVFVQSQFYAGDSGSVSHKNVDQAGAARTRAVQLFPNALFVELVDGAGYCASLRQDLRHLLFAADTYDFIQLRSIPVRLRRILQQARLIAPLEVAVRVHEGVDTSIGLQHDLQERTPGHTNVAQTVTALLSTGWLTGSGDALSVGPAHAEVVTRYAMLDQIVAASQSGYAGKTGLLVPGYGANFGTPMRADWDEDIVEQLVAAGNVMRVGA